MLEEVIMSAQNSLISTACMGADGMKAKTEFAFATGYVAGVNDACNEILERLKKAESERAKTLMQTFTKCDDDCRKCEEDVCPIEGLKE